MNSTAPRFVLGLICVLAALTSCSSSEIVSRSGAEGQAQEFSEADKIAARALSISNSPVLSKADSPYEQAVLCKDGMGLIAERFQSASGLNVEQREAIAQASAYFDQRLQSLAAVEGKTESDIKSDLQRVAEEFEIGDRSRVAIDCLRRLQEVS